MSGGVIVFITVVVEAEVELPTLSPVANVPRTSTRTKSPPVPPSFTVQARTVAVGHPVHPAVPVAPVTPLSRGYELTVKFPAAFDIPRVVVQLNAGVVFW